ncbi:MULTISPECIES: hypothetical protein [Paraburkholderia]|uniref:hypothetical protein n=1 Tax=Paraburkholderia TaxID=1822464 RepID=UPI00225A02C9|nr:MULTISPECIES: hypothetical protein [Paraburkholderia]MCX4159673.1 hypothetical protein [Paraburkholderia aspalathi]MDN7169070.1 hypothetical protein [Paraburkholderia sp. SECH2]MDQ6397558.1 hypothetical protein [Paraburkholderia aspalathi]
MMLVERGRTALIWLRANVLWRQLGRTVLALAQLVVYYYFTGDPIALQSNLILVSLYIGAAHINYGLPGVLLHAFVILVAFGTLLFAQHPCVLFAVLATLLATSAVLLGQFRENWRTFSSFYLIPSVYMAMDLFEQNHGMYLWSVLNQVVRNREFKHTVSRSIRDGWSRIAASRRSRSIIDVVTLKGASLMTHGRMARASSHVTQTQSVDATDFCCFA